MEEQLQLIINYVFNLSVIERREIYFIAIIDVLTQYGVKKQVSRMQIQQMNKFKDNINLNICRQQKRQRQLSMVVMLMVYRLVILNNMPKDSWNLWIKL